MSMHETDGRGARWTVPAVSVLIGIGYLVAGLIGDDLGMGLGGLAIMVAVALGFLLLARHSETVAGLADRQDERINSIDRDASLAAGMVLLVTVIVMFMVELARGRDGSPYYQLAALGGATYLVALVWLRLRR